jgi:hypothetical protein
LFASRESPCIAGDLQLDPVGFSQGKSV